MGWLKKAFKKVAKVVTFGAYHGGGGGGGSVEAPAPAPAPAPEIAINKNDEGEAEEKAETANPKKARKGKKALKITKDDKPVFGVGRNIV